MARKAVNGYPEKSYYDNTRFGGVVATSDPLNEGSFALVTNFNIADTGMGLVPRNGFTTTTFKLKSIIAEGEEVAIVELPTVAEIPAYTPTTEFNVAYIYYTGNTVTHEGTTYRFITDHPAGPWNTEHVIDITGVPFDEIPEVPEVPGVDAYTPSIIFNTLYPYYEGNVVLYNGAVYIFTTNHTPGVWNFAHVTDVTIRAIEEIPAVPAIPEVAGTPSVTPDTIFNVNHYYYEGNVVLYNDVPYIFITNHVPGAWNPAHVTDVTIKAIEEVPVVPGVAGVPGVPAYMPDTIFNPEHIYYKGNVVTYSGSPYIFTQNHPAGAWAGTDALSLSPIPYYSTTKTYYPGDYVEYQGSYYYCHTISTPGQFNLYYFALVATETPIFQIPEIPAIPEVIEVPAYTPTVTFSVDYTYYKGNTVLYGSTLYIFISDHPAGPWSYGHVTPVIAGSTYSNSQAYFRDQIVLSAGAYYICTVESGLAPGIFNPIYWDFIETARAFTIIPAVTGTPAVPGVDAYTPSEIYNPSHIYYKGNVVSYLGQAYIFTEDHLPSAYPIVTKVSIATTFSSTAAYYRGQIVLSVGSYYICDIEYGTLLRGTFNIADWNFIERARDVIEVPAIPAIPAIPAYTPSATFSTLDIYQTGNIVTHEGRTYIFTSDHPAGLWDPGHVVDITEVPIIEIPAIPEVPAYTPDVIFNETHSYFTGNIVSHYNEDYIFIADHTPGPWDATQVRNITDAAVTLSDKVLFFRDPGIQKDIIIDLNKALDDTYPFAYIVDVTQYNLEDNILVGEHLITGYDTTDLTTFVLKDVADADEITNKLTHIFMNSTILGNPQLKAIRDTEGVVYYITKLHYTNTAGDSVKYWIKFLYRENTTTVGGVTYTGDTLVLSVIDMSSQTTNFEDRNIASETSIIPNPIRTQEVVGVATSEVTDVNRPILLNIEGSYAATKLPISRKSSLNVNVVPTFHLQDPARIVGGTNAKWGYSFHFINTSEAEGTVTYKTPWRNLPVGNTVESQAGVDNEIIPELELELENSSDLVYTYYMFSDKEHSWHQSIAETAFLTGLSEAEEKLYEIMRYNGTVGSSGSLLGNLAFAYLKHKSILNTLSTNITLGEVDSTLYDQMNFRFFTEDSLAGPMFSIGYNLETYTERTVALSEAQVSACAGVYPSATTDSLNAPIAAVSYNEYLAAKKMTFAEFIQHAEEKKATHKIRIVFLPYIYRHAGTAGTTPFDTVYLCSVGGIYVEGLKTHPSETTGDIADFPTVVSAKKSFTFKHASLERYVDVFDNLGFGNLNLNSILTDVPRTCFEQGIFIKLHLKPYNDAILAEYVEATTQEKEMYNVAWDASAFVQSAVAAWVNDRDVVYLDEVDEENPSYIREADDLVVFEDRLVAWNGNRVFISEEGDYYYFTKIMKKVFPEEVLKVITFKTILLVFTTQNLYAIYRAEVDTFTGAYTAQGLPEYEKTIVWLQQPVLYNINPDKKYLDMIQVYNQMILFYSNEGQLYMIKPSTMIDSETQFSIQYFNKSANDILANYEQYINERLKYYNKLDVDDPTDYVTKEDVNVTGLIDIDLIKIIYTVPGRITFILIYDVVNNRYTTYDTLSFTEITNVRHVEGGECYLTQYNNNTFFTLPVLNTKDVDMNVDMHFANSFRREPLFALIDSGSLNLNNHIQKRLRDLKIIIKNLDATKILYNAEVLLDETIIYPFYAPNFKVRVLNGPDSTLKVDRVPLEDMNELFGMNQTIGEEGSRTDLNSYYLYEDANFFLRNSLLKTETLNSSRLIEYNSSILGLGKVVRIRMQFISKGKYKLQSFGIVYKERRL